MAALISILLEMSKGDAVSWSGFSIRTTCVTRICKEKNFIIRIQVHPHIRVWHPDYKEDYQQQRHMANIHITHFYPPFHSTSLHNAFRILPSALRHFTNSHWPQSGGLTKTWRADGSDDGPERKWPVGVAGADNGPGRLADLNLPLVLHWR